MLRTPQVMLSSQTPTNLCTCVYHQNTILALNPRHTYMPNIPIYNKDFPSSCLESPDSANCRYNECEHTNCGFEYFYPFPNDDSNRLSIKPAKWFKWENVNGRTIKNENPVQFLNFTFIQKLLQMPFFLTALSKENKQNNMNSTKFKNRRKTQMLWFCKWITQKITHVEHKMKCSQPIGIKPR